MAATVSNFEHLGLVRDWVRWPDRLGLVSYLDLLVAQVLVIELRYRPLWELLGRLLPHILLELLVLLHLRGDLRRLERAR